MTLIESLEPLPDEVAILSVVLARSEPQRVLVRGSLLIAPGSAGTGNWWSWQESHRIQPQIQPDPPGPEYVVTAGDWLAGRAMMDVDSAIAWLTSLLAEGSARPVGPLPAFSANCQPPKAPLRVSPHMDTPGSTFVLSAVRPVRGYLLPTEPQNPAVSGPGSGTALGEAEWISAPSSIWVTEDGKQWINTPLSMGVPITLAGPCQRGLFVGRMSREAWFTSLRGGEGLTTFNCAVGLEPSNIDISDLSLAFEEWVDGELVHAQQIHLEDWDTSAVRREPAVDVCLPTLGAGVTRTVRLHDRTGTFLDASGDRFPIVEKISIQVGVIGDEAPSTEVTVGDLSPVPDFVEMSEAVERVRRQHRQLRVAGADVTLVDPNADVRGVIADRLVAARGRIRIVDRYFGGDPADWAMLPVGMDTDVLLSLGSAPTSPIPRVTVRRLPGKPPPFHGRAYLWDGGGIAVDNSPDGFSNGPVLITRLDAEVVDRWLGYFTSWWASAAPA